jgi:hypothetical protein
MDEALTLSGIQGQGLGAHTAGKYGGMNPNDLTAIYFATLPQVKFLKTNKKKRKTRWKQTEINTGEANNTKKEVLEKKINSDGISTIIRKILTIIEAEQLDKQLWNKLLEFLQQGKPFFRSFLDAIFGPWKKRLRFIEKAID